MRRIHGNNGLMLCSIRDAHIDGFLVTARISPPVLTSRIQRCIATIDIQHWLRPIRIVLLWLQVLFYEKHMLLSKHPKPLNHLFLSVLHYLPVPFFETQIPLLTLLNLPDTLPLLRFVHPVRNPSWGFLEQPLVWKQCLRRFRRIVERNQWVEFVPLVLSMSLRVSRRMLILNLNTRVTKVDILDGLKRHVCIWLNLFKVLTSY